MDKIFGLLGWAFIIFAAIFIPHAIKKSRNAAKENGIEHEALLHAARLFDEGTKLRIRYSDQDYLNVFLAEDLELE